MKLPCLSVRSAWLLVVSGALSLVLGLLAASARPAAGAAPGGTTADCTPGVAGFPGGCADPIGDVRGAAGPDIVRVRQLEWGIIIFQVTFAKAPPLTHSTAFRDQVSVALTAVGTKATKRYLLSVSATDLKHQVLQRLPDGKRMTLPNLAHVSGKFVNLGVDLRPFVGGPVSVVRYRVQAARVMLDGTAGSSDYVPNHGTLVWSSAGA